MKILFFGDVFGSPGRAAIKKVLPEWAEEFRPDFVVANVENLAHGHGVSEKTLQELHELGIFHAYTSGNHIWGDGEAKQLLQDPKWPLIRPANYPKGAPGEGEIVVTSGTKKLLVVNLLGRLFMKTFPDDPFRMADEILSRYTLGKEEEDKERVDAILVDFHAETTSEKRAFGFYLDGRVSAVVGTHTHVPTADGQVLPKGTAYITDVGMVGPSHSSIGLKPEPIIEQFLTQLPVRTEIGDSGAEVNAALLEVNKDGSAKSIVLLRKILDIIEE